MSDRTFTTFIALLVLGGIAWRLVVAATDADGTLLLAFIVFLAVLLATATVVQARTEGRPVRMLLKRVFGRGR